MRLDVLVCLPTPASVTYAKLQFYFCYVKYLYHSVPYASKLCWMRRCDGVVFPGHAVQVCVKFIQVAGQGS